MTDKENEEAVFRYLYGLKRQFMLVENRSSHEQILMGHTRRAILNVIDLLNSLYLMRYGVYFPDKDSTKKLSTRNLVQAEIYIELE